MSQVVDAQGSDAATTDTKQQSPATSVLSACAVLLAFAGLFVGLLWCMPQLSVEEKRVLMLHFPPRKLEAIRAVRDVLISYAATNPVLTAMALCFLYVFMQTFAIPGTLSLSILSGAFYGLKFGFPLVSVVSTLGSASCYLLSWCLGKPLVHAVWPDKMDLYRREVAQRKKDLLNYILFLRVTPVLPNTFINLASPIVGVPLPVFALGTFLGCLPNNFVAVNAGVRLSELNSLRDLVDAKFIAIAASVACVALLPVVLSKRSSISSPAAGGRPHQE